MPLWHGITLVLFLFAGNVLGGSRSVVSSAPAVPTWRTASSRGWLTADKRFFLCRPPTLFASEVFVARNGFEHTARQLETMLNDLNAELKSCPQAAAWAGIASAMPNSPGSEGETLLQKYPHAAMLALLYVGKYDLAQQRGQAMLRRNPDDFGANFLMGLMAIRKKELFPYFERAFSISPSRTMALFERHFGEFRIQSSENWDFAAAVFGMLSRNLKLWESRDFPPPLMRRLRCAWFVKYTDRGAAAPIPPELQPLAARLFPDGTGDAARSLAPRKGESRALSVNPGTVLNASRTMFRYLHSRAVAPLVRETAIAFPMITPKVEAALTDLSQLPVVFRGEAAWAAFFIYETRQNGGGDLARRYPHAAMLSQMHVGNFPAAEAQGRALLQNDPDDFGANLLMGVLAIRTPQYFRHLEKAYRLSPDRTLALCDRYLGLFAIKPAEDWDFVDAFFRMLARSESSWRSPELRQQWQFKFRRAFVAKYGDFDDHEQRKKIDPELLKLAASLPDRKAAADDVKIDFARMKQMNLAELMNYRKAMEKKYMAGEIGIEELNAIQSRINELHRQSR